jgi:hypothetical protein
MWLPDRVYFNLPKLYAAAGIACLVLFDSSGPAALSAALLLSAAALTLVWRSASTNATRRPITPAHRRTKRLSEYRSAKYRRPHEDGRGSQPRP